MIITLRKTALAAASCIVPMLAHAESYVALHPVPAFVVNHSVSQVSSTVNASTLVHVIINLKLRDPQGLHDYVTQMHTFGNANYQHKLSPSEVTESFGPSQASVDTVVSYLQSQGFSNIKVAANDLLVEADAPASTVTRTFQTTLAQYRADSGRVGYANTSDIKIPSSLSGIVQGVFGLDSTTEMHSNAMKTTIASVTPSAAVSTSTNTDLTANAASTYTSGYSPFRFPAFYDVGATPTAATVNVGMIAEGNINQILTDFAAFETANGITATPTVINGTISTDTGSESEGDIDSQAIIGMTGGVKQLIFYAQPTLSTAYMLTAVNAAIADNTPIVSVSFGACESVWGSLRTQIDEKLEIAQAQGITFVVSTGDTGSVASGCSGNSVQYPASSPWVVAVGGTTLTTTPASAWSGSGGGISTLETAPSWQVKAPPLASKTFRAIPDLAYDADPSSGIQIYNQGALETGSVWGGTSLAAPLFASVWARYVSADSTLGFAAPALYDMAQATYTPFIDITTGSQTQGTAGYSAAVGWDYVTGWGSLDIGKSYTSLKSLKCLNHTPVAYAVSVWQGVTLCPGDTVTSPLGGYFLVMQTDGNLVVYSSKKVPNWSSKTTGNGVNSATFQIQNPTFSINTMTNSTVLYSVPVKTSAHAFLTMQDDGNLVIYNANIAQNIAKYSDATSPLSASGDFVMQDNFTLTAGQYAYSGNGEYELVMQFDGNLVEYRLPDHKVIWNSQTEGTGTHNYAVMQANGTFAIYTANNVLVWSLPSPAYSVLRLQDDGNLVMYSHGNAVWSSLGGLIQ